MTGRPSVSLVVQFVFAAVALTGGLMLLVVGALVTGGLVTLAGLGWVGWCLRRL